MVSRGPEASETRELILSESDEEREDMEALWKKRKDMSPYRVKIESSWSDDDFKSQKSNDMVSVQSLFAKTPVDLGSKE